MHLRSVSAVLVLGLASSVAAQQTTTAPPKPPSRTLSLSGCVQRSDTANQYTFVDPTNKTTYRLSGTDVRDYVGRRVQIVGGVVGSKRLQISGGLKPTPNVAAQAGAMDPSQAATAAAGGSAPGTGPAPTLEFRIKSIRPAEGGCPD